MSDSAPVEAPAAKKRGRPKKVVTEEAGIVAEETKKPAVKKTTAKVSASKEKVVKVEKEKEKKSPARTAKTTTTTAKKDAPKATKAAVKSQPTPVTPATSKILDEVRATGTLKATTRKEKPEVKLVKKADAPSVSKPQKTHPATILPSQPTPASPSSPTVPETQSEPAQVETTATTTNIPPSILSPPQSTIKPTSQRTPTIPEPTNQPAVEKPSLSTTQPQPPAPATKPTTTSPTPLSTPPAAPQPQQTPQHARATTIPLPRKPLVAPSPTPITKTLPHHPTTTFAKPAPSSAKPPPPQPNHNTQAHAHARYARATRIIEPTPDGKLPAKYKPAARRVTAIMVGIPVLVVCGWELFERWRGKPMKKFEDDGYPGPMRGIPPVRPRRDYNREREGEREVVKEVVRDREGGLTQERMLTPASHSQSPSSSASPPSSV